MYLLLVHECKILNSEYYFFPFRLSSPFIYRHIYKYKKVSFCFTNTNLIYYFWEGDYLSNLIKLCFLSILNYMKLIISIKLLLILNVLFNNYVLIWSNNSFHVL